MTPGRRARRRQRAGGPRRWLAWAFGACLLALAGGVAAVLGAAPRLDAVATPAAASLIYDRYGQLVAAVPGTVDRQPVPLAQIPPVLQHAFVATEDRRFYTSLNDGIDVRGLLRSAWEDLRGAPRQGGSTIADQLAKNLFLASAPDTLGYKLREIALGIAIASRYSKPQILEQYLNIIYLGEGAYGVQAASLRYFGVPVQRIDLPQAALLAGLTQAPSVDDPLVHPDLARARRNTVLALMAEQGYITPAQARAAAAAPLKLAPRPPAVASGGQYPDPWFVDAVVSELEHQYGFSAQQLATGGLRIETTLDPKVQAAADQAVAGLDQAGGRLALSADPPLQVAEVVLDPQTGDVLAIVGGRQHTTAMAYDRALQAVRQPGSAIKPLAVYTPALLAGLTPGTVVDDSLHTFGSGPTAYTPVNDDGRYYGLTTLTEALRRSVNTVAVQVLDRIGVQRGLDVARSMGLPLTAHDAHLALALGGTSDCCTPLAMADAYATLANGGYHVTPRVVTRVLAPDGRVLLSNPVRRTRVLPAAVAFVMTKMLETVDEPQPNQGWNVLSGPLDSNWGTGYDAQVQDNVPGWPTAGKTGTTSNNLDAWYVGYTPALAAAVWMGYDQPQPFPGLYGGVYAGPVFRDTLAAALAGRTPTDFPEPAGVTQAPIDIKAAPWTVALPSPLTPPADIRTEWFVAGTEPTAESNLWVRLRVDPNAPQLLWDPSCGDAPVSRVFLDRPRYTPALARRMALAAQVTPDQGGWRSVMPVDMALAPPTQSCASYAASAGSGG